MQFLTPVPAIVAAAVAVPLLLGLYFLKLRRRPVRVSSTMFWVSRTRDLQANVPFKWIRPSWMLLLQLLILALLLLALARPAIEGGAGAGGRTVVLIDRSASMTARDAAGGVTRLEAAKRRALEIVDRAARAGSGASLGVVVFAARAEMASGLSSQWRSLRRAVRAIEPTHQRADLGAAMDLVGAMASRSRDEESTPAPLEVVVIGDGAYGADRTLAVPGGRVRFERVGPPLPEGVEVAGTDNLGIAALSARRAYEEPGLVRLFARLVNASAVGVDTSLLVTLDEAPLRRVPVSVPPGIGEDGPEGGARPGATVTLELDLPSEALVGLRVDRPDVLAADDAAHVVLGAPATPRIAHVVPGDAETDPSDWILTGLLGEIAGPGYTRLDIGEYRELARAGRTPEASLIVFDRVWPASLPPVPSITFAMESALRGASALEAAAAATRVLGWERTHPVLRDVSLDGLYVAQAAPVGLEGDGEGVRVLATGRTGPLIVLERAGGRRHVWVAFEPVQSNWPTEPGFVIFVANAVDYLTMRGASVRGRAYTPNEPVRIRPPADAERIVLTGPTRVETGVQTARAGRDPEVSVGLLPLAGVYRVRGVPGAAGLVPVNVGAEVESLAHTRASIEVGGRRVGSGQGGEGSAREVWHWFVIAAAVLLAAEWFLVAWVNRA